MKRLFLFLIATAIYQLSSGQNVGIGTNTPNSTALLHVFTGTNFDKGLLVNGTTDPTGAIPNLGSGTRLMFYPGKAVFRAGIASASGWDNSNCGYASVAFGDGSIASGTHSFAMNSATATGTHSIALGYGSTSFGSYSVCLSSFGGSSGSYSFSSGNNNAANGAGSFAAGSNSVAWALGSVTFGNTTIAQAPFSTTVGVFNDPVLASTESSVADYTPLFIIGNGNGPANRSNAFVVRKDGYVGIGTNAPSQLLTVAGNICATGSIASCSDIRYKTNILPVSNVLTSLLALHGIYYNWKKEFIDKGFSTDRQIGLSAQEIEKFFPEMVQTNKDGYKAIDYSRMAPVVIEAIKEQQQQIETLKKSIKESDQKLANQETRILVLEKKLKQLSEGK